MRDNDSSIAAALAAAPQTGIAPRQLIWITAIKRADGSIGSFGFWTERLPVTINVQVGDTTEARTYQGDGAVISVDKIPLTSDISVRQVSFKLSLIHPTVRDLWGDYILKLAKVEIHRVPLDPIGYLPLGIPQRRFKGSVDQAPRTVPQPGSEGGIEIRCVSASADLRLINPAKRSDETQKRRAGIAAPGGDRHSRYADVVGSWTVPWGQSS